jgi:hypothetical protein
MEMKEINTESRIEPLLTVADLDAFPEDDGNRYELIEGELFVSVGPGISHQRVLQNLQIEFGLFLKAHPIGILVPGAGALRLRGNAFEEIATLTSDDAITSPLLPGFHLKISAIFI